MRVLVIGSGGREHALAWAIAKSPRLEKLIVAPGNGGTESIATNAEIDITDHAAIIALAKAERVDLVVIGPDAPAVAGLADDVRAAGLLCFGPSKAAARLEGSKAFTKSICDEAGVPTAAYGSFDNEADALAYLRSKGAPIVVKADGLAAGKGVRVAGSMEEAEDAVRDCFSGAFGESGSTVVIEEFLEGEEASVFALCDGHNIVMLPSAQDHKQVWDGDRGPNTGGMGAYSPAPVMTPEMTERVRREIIEPTIRRMAERGSPFTGVLFAGLMIGRAGPKLIEYNVRFGDPECQVLMMRLKSDALDLLEATARGRSRVARRGGAHRGHGDARLPRQRPERQRDQRRRRAGRRRSAGVPRRHQARRGTAARQWRARAERDRPGPDGQRGAGPRLCRGGPHRLAGGFLPSRHWLAGGGTRKGLNIL